MLHDVTTAAIAAWLMASGFEGWRYRLGRTGWLARGFLVLGAVVRPPLRQW